MLARMLQARAARADHRNDGQAPQHPCQHRDEAVAAAVDDRRAEDRPREPARSDRFLGGPLGLVIARSRAGPRPERAHVNVAANTGFHGRAQHVYRALDVDSLERRVEGGLLTDDPDEVHDRVAAADVGIEATAHQHVALDALDGAEPLEIPLGAAADEAAHDVAFGAEGLDHCPTYETGPSGDKHPSHDAPIP